MRRQGLPWGIVLAAGDGTRLSQLTTDTNGRSKPKQFWSLDGGPSLFRQALARARRTAPAERVLAVVAERHRAFWSAEVADLASENVLVQGENRGTAAGLLLPLCAIVERDAHARVAVLPSDHLVEDEDVLAAALRAALLECDAEHGCVTLLGIVPEAPETDYGWIVPVGWTGPAGAESFPRRVARFVEKPAPALACELMDRGGLWNAFLLAGRVEAFLGLYARRLPRLLARFSALFLQPAGARAAALARLYAVLPAADVSRDILQGSESHLRVQAVPACGWTDLGTPQRVAECLRRGVSRRAVAAKASEALTRAPVFSEALVDARRLAPASPARRPAERAKSARRRVVQPAHSRAARGSLVGAGRPSPIEIRAARAEPRLASVGWSDGTPRGGSRPATPSGSMDPKEV